MIDLWQDGAQKNVKIQENEGIKQDEKEENERIPHGRKGANEQ